MSAPLLWTLVALGFAIVVVRRRSAAVALLAVQSLLLGALAIAEAVDTSHALLVAAIVLAVRGVALPAALAFVIARTRERRRIAAERFALGRLVAAVAVALAAVALAPPLGLEDAGAARAAVALVALGIVIAAARRAVVLQVVGVLVAENGVYLASLAVAGGAPAAIELGLVCDLVAVVAVVAALGAKIHEQLGSGDTTMLETLRD